jgi:hypothetical protein
MQNGGYQWQEAWEVQCFCLGWWKILELDIPVIQLC